MCDFEEQIRKIIDVLTIALRCSQSGLNQSDFKVRMENALGNLNFTALLDVGTKVPTPAPRPLLMGQSELLRIISPLTTNLSTTDSTPVSTSILHAFNSTDSAGSFSTTSTPPTSTPTLTPMLKLHRLELIKVAVLVIVISIILITTCRMVFQLFLRYRPEKGP